MTTESRPLGNQRAHFDIPEDVIYLTAASKSVLPIETVKAGQIGAAAKGHAWEIDDPTRYKEANDVRQRFADFIGATADDIAIHPSVAYGIATIAKNLPLPHGSRVIVIEGQFPSNVYAWQDLAKECGAEVVCVPRPEDHDWTSAVLSHLDDRVALVTLPPCHWTDGTILDLKKIGPAAKSLGATFVVDATQWVGAQSINIHDIQADYFVAAGYKWLLGPYGLSFFYAAPECQTGRPLERHTYNHSAGAVDELGQPNTFTAGARRFDAGEFLNLISLPMTNTSMRLVHEWGPDRIGQYLEPITDRIADGAEVLGYQVAPKSARSPHFLGIQRDGGFPDDIVKRLEAKNVFITSRGGGIRISPHVFNDVGHADIFLDRLQEVL